MIRISKYRWTLSRYSQCLAIEWECRKSLKEFSVIFPLARNSKSMAIRIIVLCGAPLEIEKLKRFQYRSKEESWNLRASLYEFLEFTKSSLPWTSKGRMAIFHKKRKRKAQRNMRKLNNHLILYEISRLKIPKWNLGWPFTRKAQRSSLKHE